MHPATSATPSHEIVDRIRRGKISLGVAQAIVRRIAIDNLSQGSPLPTEQAMATQFGVGRASIREALRLLELQGIVEIPAATAEAPSWDPLHRNALARR